MAVVDLMGREVGGPKRKACPFWSHPANDGSWIGGDCKAVHSVCVFWLDDVGQCLFFNLLAVARAAQEKPEEIK